MNELKQLADLLSKRNEVDSAISEIIGRSAEKGHIGEYIAAQIFSIKLNPNASEKGFDGEFTQEPLKGKKVNIKYYGKREGILDIKKDNLDIYYLVMTGPISPAVSSQGQSRPIVVEGVYLFNAKELIKFLEEKDLKIGVASSVKKELWEKAMIYPEQRNTEFIVSPKQIEQLQLFECP